MPTAALPRPTQGLPVAFEDDQSGDGVGVVFTLLGFHAALREAFVGFVGRGALVDGGHGAGGLRAELVDELLGALGAFADGAVEGVGRRAVDAQHLCVGGSGWWDARARRGAGLVWW